MTVPKQPAVADELLKLLYSTPHGRMHCQEVYIALAPKFPELTRDDTETPYRESKSKWANTVQFSRLSCINKGYIYRLKDQRSGGKGYWTITEIGRDYVRSNSLVPGIVAEVEEPEDIVSDQLYYEGAIKQITVNVYERNVEARRSCLNYYGTKCCVCNFDFKAFYGLIGEGFIHVHHIKPLVEIGEEYELDPISDLRPVCPNCHAIIHRKKPAYTIEEVKAFVSIPEL